MKCPYRVKKTTEVKHVPSSYISCKAVDVKTTENTDFENCYEILCPCFDRNTRGCNFGK